MHASTLIRKLRDMRSDIEISGISGPAMRQAGCKALADMNELNVMGVVDVLKSLPRIRQVRQRILQWAEKEHPDVAILVDFPGFHINIGRKLRQMGIPVVQYIAPKLWAWGAWRAGNYAILKMHWSVFYLSNRIGSHSGGFTPDMSATPVPKHPAAAGPEMNLCSVQA